MSSARPGAEWSPGATRPRRRDRLWLHILLFLATIFTTSVVGAGAYQGWLTDFSRVPLPAGSSPADLWLGGLWYSFAALGILTAHELGHYFACRHYGVDASLPYYLPNPLPLELNLIGTFGAVIRIRQPIASKRMLFDIAVAGPIAGFLVAIPMLLLGMSWSKVTAMPSGPNLINLGEPFVFQLTAGWVFGSLGADQAINMHPVVFGAWLGLLATALNLVPVGQLDGGHISYAVFGRKSRSVSILAVATTLALGLLYSPTWFYWAGLFTIFLLVFGFRHPSTIDEREPLDGTRMWIAFSALVMFALCFTPTPISPTELVGQ
ncbi:MAG: site-2 protease family protein [Luteitalea sp.]|nr:site-2 protease family protein [Luteitalea sp.]